MSAQYPSPLWLKARLRKTHSEFRTMVKVQRPGDSEFYSHAGNKQKSSETMKMKMFATLDKARPHTENIRGSNLAAVMYTTVQVSKTEVVD
jgi:hypothetical protein